MWRNLWLLARALILVDVEKGEVGITNNETTMNLRKVPKYLVIPSIVEKIQKIKEYKY